MTNKPILKRPGKIYVPKSSGQSALVFYKIIAHYKILGTAEAEDSRREWRNAIDVLNNV